jgi:hypothetical protein
MPQQIQNYRKNEADNIAYNMVRHELLPSDYDKINKAIKNYYSVIERFHDIKKLLSKSVNHLEPLVKFINLFPTFFNKENTPEGYNTRLLYIRLFKTCILSIFAFYIELTDDLDLSIMIENENNEMDENEIVIGEEVNINIRTGNVKQGVYELLVVFLEKMEQVKNTTFVTYKDIMSRITRSREREKKQIKNYLASMDPETRKAEVLMKKNHLGIWKENKDFDYRKNLVFGEVDEQPNEAALMEAHIERMDEEEDRFQQELEEDAPLDAEEPDEDYPDIIENAYDSYNEYSDHDEY